MPSTANREKICTFFSPIQSVKVHHIKQMYEVYANCYENASLDAFLTDLSKKSGVILATRKCDDKIVGFSAQTFFDIPVGDRRVRGMFSGDTVMEPAYRARHAMDNTIYRRLFIERAKRPFTPFYWLLSAKGYKAYLQITNNFTHYSPKIGENRGHRKQLHLKITQACCESLLPSAFDKEAMLLDFGHECLHPKSEPADITPEVLDTSPLVAFFEKINPSWRQGTAVPCLAACDYQSLLRALAAGSWAWIKKHMFGAHTPAGRAMRKQQEQPSQRQPWLQANTDQAGAGTKGS